MLLRLSAVMALLLSAGTAGAAVTEHDSGQSAVFANPEGFAEQGGETVYRHICAGCHMPDGKGAAGAGAYPALAGDRKLVAAGYPVAIVLHGHKAMPPFGPLLSDHQIAEVVNFIRTHFGNELTDPVDDSEVRALR